MTSAVLPRPVLADSVTRVLPVTTALVARICDKRQTPELVSWLATNVPVPALGHLKRVKSVQLGDGTALFVLIDLLECVFPALALKPPVEPGGAAPQPGLADTLYAAPVAAGRPLTRRQYTQSAALWPTVFHRDQRLEAHAVMRAVDAVAAAQGGGAWLQPAAPPPPPQPAPAAAPYLCTGYEAFVTREPCVMCAMALLHSRIGRVYYGRRRPDGALGSLCKLHVTEGLNHRFEVFAGLCEELCEQVGGEDGS
ncbi:probable inactive tRNA-specific adenosine deaminase-like protein 3 [Pollicipes pollicipes]|uniref:probable inactive tRNA-specific adenosine deaminase-like protein 3 n=1 Tax=Pollicipes pollicipes TaxID=41117 RepID=UPI001885415C|nr:probable inactive tRNA-specific adenosine deaminase-like protein 3 [Pollicipes pollicipes]